MKSECLKCGYIMNHEASLCIHCLAEEIKKMEHGEQTGYLYAAEMYQKLKEKEGKE